MPGGMPQVGGSLYLLRHEGGSRGSRAGKLMPNNPLCAAAAAETC